MSELKKYLNFYNDEKLSFGIILFQLYWAKLLLVFLPFKSVIKIVKNRGEVRQINKDDLFRIQKSLRLANKLSVWDNRCLVNTLAIRQYLNYLNISSSAFLGVKHGGSREFLAHAWLEVDGTEIVTNDDGFTQLLKF